MSHDQTTSVLDRRKALLRQRLAEQGLAAQPDAGSAVARAVAGERYPLSAGQRRMWFLQARDPQDTTLNICVAYRLSGPLDADRLRVAAAAVVNRHDVLRTVYGLGDDGEPYQVVRDDLECGWQTHDLVDLTEFDRTSRLAVLARREYGRPFTLADESPLRVTLVRVTPDEHVLLLTAHHICWDDDSWMVFFGDLAAAYRGSLSSLPAQFLDVAVLADGADTVTDADLDHWRVALRPLPEPLELPGVGVAGHAGPKQAERVTVALPPDLIARVQAFAVDHGATPFMVWLASYQAVIHRYTAATDFLVSVPVTIRPGEAGPLIGYFGNTVLLRAAMASATFASLVESVRETCLDAFAHQQVGIDQVVREANPDRVGGRDGWDQLVRLGFSVRQSAAGVDLAGVAATQLVEFGSQVAPLPLSVAVVTEPDRSYLEAEYQIANLDRTLVEQLLAHCVQLLDSALANPHSRVGDIDMLGTHDRAGILASSVGAVTDAQPGTLIALFEDQARAVPDALAIVAPGEAGAESDVHLSYDALNRRANRLAHWLIGQGIGPEDIVGLRLSNSVEFVVALLAVLKAGAAYLPIDPAYPDDRIDYLVVDASPRLVMGRAELSAAENVANDLPETDPGEHDRRAPLRPDNLAYVIYTSGSTGKPKGVPVSHAAIAEHLTGFVAEWSMTAQDRLLQSSSVSFDASLLDIFVTLTLGARLVIPKPDAFRDIAYVAELITRCGVTVLHMVPSMLSTFLLLPEVSQWRALRLVPVGGEALPGEVADKFAGVFDAELRNHYGPTEAVVCATHMNVDGPQGARIVPIGVPNRGVAVYLLDSAMQLVPPGVIGEIYLGGAQLARGYLNRRGLTAERFVADPFARGSRLYRTGDLARRQANGDIEFVGRADEQVKVRGFRIELGEVEAALTAYPGVGHCVVDAVTDSAVGAMLAAYVVPANGFGEADVDLDALRAHAATTLPEYMVPGAFAVIPEIPLTAHGKLDRRALPELRRASVTQFREPATATEIRVARLFARIFGRDHIGADDSFFALGGHSLLATRLVVQLRAEFGVEIDVRAPFDAPTVAALAAVIEAAPGGAGRALPALMKRDRPDRVPLSYSQLALWFQRKLEGPSAIGNIAFAVQLTGPLDVAALASALTDVVTRHEVLRTVFPEAGGVPYQQVLPAGPVALPVTELSDSSALRAALAEAGGHCFAIDTERLIRPRLFRLDQQTHALSLLVHHLVADHWSFRIMLADLSTAYRARCAGDGPDWAPLPLDYADYALWQRDIVDSLGPQVDYWRDTLASMPDEIAVAPNRSRPSVLGKNGHVVPFEVPAALRAQLRSTAASEAASEFMIYQAAVVALLNKLGAGTDIPLGTPVAGRADPHAADLVGLLANMVILRTDLSGDPTLRDLVGRSRAVALGAYSNQDIPIERVVEALNPPRSRSRNPLFQAMMHFREEEWDGVDLADGTSITPLPLDFDTSLLDLSVNFFASPRGGFDGSVIVNTDLYDPATGELFAECMVQVLTAFAVTPDRALSDLRIAPEADALVARGPSAPVERTAGDCLPVARNNTETERILIDILQELLDIEDVAADDNFFALGGDSVISIQWSARAVEIGLLLTPPMIFEHLTITELAAAVDAAAPPAVPVVAPTPQNLSGLTPDALAKLTTTWRKAP